MVSGKGGVWLEKEQGIVLVANQVDHVNYTGTHVTYVRISIFTNIQTTPSVYISTIGSYMPFRRLRQLDAPLMPYIQCKYSMRYRIQCSILQPVASSPGSAKKAEKPGDMAT